MPVTPIRGSGMNLGLVPQYNTQGIAPYLTSVVGGFNELSLPAGASYHLPAGNYFVTPGLHTLIQVKDPVTGLWRNYSQTPQAATYLVSDGQNVRVTNRTGTAIGATVTNVGSGYTSAPTVTASAGGSTWTAIVGGAVNSTVTITTAGAGYNYAPILLVSSPPAGGVQATMTCTISGGAINAVTVVDQGAGYTSAPTITVLPDPRDTGPTTPAVLTAALTGSGTVTAVVCTNRGTALTSVPTLTFAGGGGSSAAATVAMCFTATGFSVGAGGAAYGNAQPFLVQAVGGQAGGTPGAVVNPSISTNLLKPRMGIITGTSTAGGAITATGAVVVDGGLFAAVPTGIVTAGGSGLATTVGQATITVGGVTDTVLIQPL